MEVEKRVLRIKDQGPPARSRARSRFRETFVPWLPAQPVMQAGGVPAWTQEAAPRIQAVDRGMADRMEPTFVPQEQPAARVEPHREVQPVEDRGAFEHAKPHVAAPASSETAGAPDVAVQESGGAPDAAQTAAGAGGIEDQVRAAVLQVISEKTGYPQDMLELDLDLEADLGIDTVKQAETFAELRERFEIPKDDSLKLKDYPTIERVIGFVLERSPLFQETGGTPEGASSQESAGTPGAEEEVRAAVLQVISEKTGYPQDMLELDLDLEADLGIDTVKQAETFAELRERFEIPKDDSLKLKDYPTIERVIGFVLERSPIFRESAGTLKEEGTQETAGTPGGEWVVRRRPVVVPRPAADIFRSTGVDLSKAKVILVKDEAGVHRELEAMLSARSADVVTIEPSSDEDEVEATVEEALAGSRPAGVFWLPGLGNEPDLLGASPRDWDVLVARRVKAMHRLARALYGYASEPGFFFISATRAGGRHGYDERGSLSCVAGGISGFTKALSKELPQALCKVVDFDQDSDGPSVAAALLAEVENDPAAIEVGYSGGARWMVETVEAGIEEEEPAPDLGDSPVFVVTGAAGGITSEIVADLAGHYKGTFYLMDKFGPGDESDPRLDLLEKDRDGLKRELFQEMKEQGLRPTPKEVEGKVFELERRLAALKAKRAVEKAGGKAVFMEADLLDHDSVSTAVERIRKSETGVSVLVHAAGVEISRSIADKTAREFDLVLDVKAKGLLSLLSATADMPVRTVVAFSSVAGRFGNQGQTDYSAANDLMCKTLSAWRRLKPGSSAVAVDWTAWANIGMASRGSLPKILEAAGVDLLPPKHGIPRVRMEISRGTGFKEVVVARNLGAIMGERDPLGGLDPDRLAARLEAEAGPFLAAADVTGARMTSNGLEVEVVFDPTDQPFLEDHQVEEGVPYLPGVVGMECLAEVAALLLGSAETTVRNVSFQRPIKFHRMEPKRLLIKVEGGLEADVPVARAELYTVHMPRKLQVPERLDLHFTAEFLPGVGPGAEAGSKAVPKLSGRSKVVDKGEIYKTYFHGPSFQVLEEVKLQKGKAVGALARGIPPELKSSTGSPLLHPRLVELCFQTAGLWEMQEKHMLCLPQSVQEARVVEPPPQDKDLYALVEPVQGEQGFDAKVVDGKGKVYIELKGYRTVAIQGMPGQE